MKSFIVFAVLFSCFTANAQKTFTTSTGSVFTQVYKSKFGAKDFAWKDPSGKVWSDTVWDSSVSVYGLYGNEALEPDKGDMVVKTPATEACKKIGGKLPTAQEFAKLLSYFDSVAGPTLSEKGRMDFFTLFPDAGGRIYWTASINTKVANRTFLFNGHFGYVDYSGDIPNRDLKAFVRCIN